MLSTFFVISGTVLLILALFALLFRPIASLTADRNPPPAQYLKSLFQSIPLFIASMIAFSSQGAVFYAEPGYQYLVQYLTGTQVPVFEPGYHLRLWGNVIEFKSVLSVVADTAKHNDTSGDYDALTVRFNDAVKADVEVASRFRLPQDPAHFTKLALEYRSQENLINATIIRQISEVTINSARMFSAQDYVSGKGGEFETAVLDQLRDGVYQLNISENEIRGDEDISHTTEDRTIPGTDKRVRLTVSKALNKDGVALRKESSIAAYGIEVTQCTISNVIMEQKFADMLAKQRDAAAQASVARQEAQTAGFEKLKIIAQGESEKAQKRVEEEKRQIEQIISVETQQKAEVGRLEIEKIKLQQADIQGQQIERLAKAEAFKKKAILEADNALEIKLTTLREINQAYATALTGKQLVPSVVIGGGHGGEGGSSALTLIDLMTAKFAKDLAIDNFPVAQPATK